MDVTFDATVKGQPAKIIMDNDPAWGLIKDVIKMAQAGGAAGYDGFTFFQELAIACIKDGLPFQKTNRVEWAQLPTSEVTFIVGRVMRELPLEKYLSNLGLKDNPVISQLMQQ